MPADGGHALPRGGCGAAVQQQYNSTQCSFSSTYCSCSGSDCAAAAMLELSGPLHLVGKTVALRSAVTIQTALDMFGTLWTEFPDLWYGFVHLPQVSAEWSPDGRQLMVATTAPRLRVDNAVKVITYYGQQVGATRCTRYNKPCSCVAPCDGCIDRILVPVWSVGSGWGMFYLCTPPRSSSLLVR